MEVEIAVQVADAAGRERASGLKDKLERYCPISASLGFPVKLNLDVGAAG